MLLIQPLRAQQFPVSTGQGIFWLGESHGTVQSYKTAFDMIKAMSDSQGIDYLLIESGFMVEFMFNKYLSNGSDTLLNRLMELSRGTVAYTVQKREYYKKIYELNAQLDPDNKIRVVSIDIEHTPLNAHYYIRTLYRQTSNSDTTLVISKINSVSNTQQFDAYYSGLEKDIAARPDAYQSLFPERHEEIKYIVRNINYSVLSYKETNIKKWDRLRDSLIYENFKIRNREFDFSASRTFAFWGSSHTAQEKFETGIEFIAARIKRLNPEIPQTTFYCLYARSSFLFSEFEAPGVVRWIFPKEKGQYRISKRIMNSNNLAIHVNGTNYLRKKAEKDVEIFAMDTLPDKKDFLHRRDKSLSNSDYAQYVILIQNSEACESLN